jgi:hypothetical protein
VLSRRSGLVISAAELFNVGSVWEIAKISLESLDRIGVILLTEIELA